MPAPASAGSLGDLFSTGQGDQYLNDLVNQIGPERAAQIGREMGFDMTPYIKKLPNLRGVEASTMPAIMPPPGALDTMPAPMGGPPAGLDPMPNNFENSGRDLIPGASIGHGPGLAPIDPSAAGDLQEELMAEKFPGEMSPATAPPTADVLHGVQLGPHSVLLAAHDDQGNPMDHEEAIVKFAQDGLHHGIYDSPQSAAAAARARYAPSGGSPAGGRPDLQPGARPSAPQHLPRRIEATKQKLRQVVRGGGESESDKLNKAELARHKRS